MNKETFKSIRTDNQLTQKELADYLGLSEPYISYMENGHKPIVKRTEMAMNSLKKEK